MTQHFYGDLSNLNAPYDAVPLQGLGQQYAVPDNPKYPWKVQSQDTFTLQQDLNEGLTAAGGCLLTEDGYLGPKTCGAAKHFGVMESIQTCVNHADSETYTLPEIPCGTGGGGGGGGAQVIEGEEEEDLLVPKTGQIPGWLIGVGIGALAIGVAVYLKKKK